MEAEVRDRKAGMGAIGAESRQSPPCLPSAPHSCAAAEMTSPGSRCPSVTPPFWGAKGTCVDEEEENKASGSPRQKVMRAERGDVLIHEAFAGSQGNTRMGRGSVTHPLSSRLSVPQSQPYLTPCFILCYLSRTSWWLSAFRNTIHSSPPWAAIVQRLLWLSPGVSSGSAPRLRDPRRGARRWRGMGSENAESRCSVMWSSM